MGNIKIVEFLETLSLFNKIVLIGPMLTKKIDVAAPIILVDGGVDKISLLSDWENFPTLSVGDGDSTTCKLDVLLEKEKNFSDFSYALSLIPREIKRIECFGFLGGRRDHEYINIGEVYSCLSKKERETTLCLDHNFKGFAAGSYSLEITGLFSLFTLRETQILLEGNCKYELKSWTTIPPLSSFGLSNEGQGFIRVNSKGPFFILQN